MVRAPTVNLSAQQREILERHLQARKSPQGLVIRISIVLLAAEDMASHQIGVELGVDYQRVRRWRRRWADAQEELAEAEQSEEGCAELEDLILKLFKDRYRSGTKPTFSAEQLTQIIALACEGPEESDLPVTHWTPSELAREAISRGIVKSISPRHIDRFLKSMDLRPHKSRYWLTSPDKAEDPETFQKDSEVICETYAAAQSLEENGTHVISCDERTGIQALERKSPTLPPRPGKVERIEFEYIRHGTLCLIANFVVATGRILMPTIGPTRKEQDFASHIRQTVATDEKAAFIFIVDQLNTHISESLVRLAADHCDIKCDLGIKGKSGILKNMKSRKAFLSNPAHRIRFIYTPRHSSWLNQVELWFSILGRRVIKRGNFSSLDALKTKLERFIRYFNKVLAKPFKWTYTGKPLAA